MRGKMVMCIRIRERTRTLETMMGRAVYSCLERVIEWKMSAFVTLNASLLFTKQYHTIPYFTFTYNIRNIRVSKHFSCQGKIDVHIIFSMTSIL